MYILKVFHKIGTLSLVSDEFKIQYQSHVESGKCENFTFDTFAIQWGRLRGCLIILSAKIRDDYGASRRNYAIVGC